MQFKADYLLFLIRLIAPLVLLFFFELIFCSQILFAQNSTHALKQGFQSPESASLGKYGEVPVSYYTGTPDITIPLYTVRSGEIEFPISLSYHASGIKVNEIASWVGLGWNLNASGVITRTIRGTADESTNGYLFTYDSLYNDKYWPLSQSYIRNYSGCSVDDLPCLVQMGAVDTEPDLYFYNFNGHIGKFVQAPTELVPDGIVLIPYNNLQIQPTGNGVYEWTITTQNGTKYVFGSSSGLGAEVERISNATVTYWDGGVAEGKHALRNYNSGWWLREIIPPDSSEPIKFYYDKVTQQSDWKDKVYEMEQLSRCIVNSANYNKRVQATMQQLTTSQPYLTRIETGKETILFVASEDRQDQPFGTSGLKKLKEVKILSKDGSLKKHFTLNYGYFNSDQAKSMRLRLQAVRELSMSPGTDDQRWSFDYIGQNGGINLPEYGSFAKDYWGYFNGAVNTTGLPKIPELNIDGADRNPNSNVMQAGMLNRVTYPTGGYTELTYEPNDYGRIGSKWIPKESFQERVIQRREDISFYLTAYELYGGGGNIDKIDWISKNLSIQSVNNQEFVSIDIQWPTISNEYHAEVLIENASDGSFVTSFMHDSGSSPGNESKEIEIEPGTYTVKMRGISVCDQGCYVTWGNIYTVGFDIGISWSETHRDTTINNLARLGGGARIKTIRTYDGMNSQAQRVENFSYRLSSDTSRSSGVIVNEPINYYKIDFVYCHDVKQRSSSSYVPLGSLGGRHIGYSEVQVSYGENGENGKKRFSYTNAGEFPDIKYPGSLGDAFNYSNTSNEWRRGYLKQADYFSKSGSLLSKMSHVYAYHVENMPLLDGQFDPNKFDINYDYPGEVQSGHPLVSVLRASSYTFPVTSKAINSFGDPVYISYAVQSPYYLVGGWVHPDKERLQVYDATGKYIYKETNYLYEERASSSAVGLLREVEKNASGAPSRRTSYIYAFEHYPDMATRHMLNQPYEVTVRDGQDSILRIDWTLWKQYGTDWHPCGRWVGDSLPGSSINCN